MLWYATGVFLVVFAGVTWFRTLVPTSEKFWSTASTYGQRLVGGILAVVFVATLVFR
jgi:hypothetical protein